MSFFRPFLRALPGPLANREVLGCVVSAHISLHQVQNEQLHAFRSALRRILRLAVCHSENLALPSRTSRSVSHRITSCQPGESILASSWLRSAHSASIARSLSVRDIRLIGNVTAMRIVCRTKCPPARRNGPRRRWVSDDGGCVFGVRPSPGAAMLESNEDVRESRAPACSVVAAPGDGRTPPKPIPAVTTPLLKTTETGCPLRGCGAGAGRKLRP